MQTNSPFTKFAWFNLFYNLLVILFGAFVRATGAGAGCGEHWPKCNGEIVPRPQQIETIIEFTHRTTAGLSLLLVFLLWLWAKHIYATGHRVRRAAFWALFFMIVEAFIGAGLVLFRYVADDASVGRAWWMSAHLVNTYILLAVIALTAWFASGAEGVKLKSAGIAARLQLVLLPLLVLLGMSGALAALGDTLFPGTVGLRWDVHFYVTLRNLHPFIAVAVSGFILAVVYRTIFETRNLAANRMAYLLGSLTVLQLVLGAFNIILSAPVWLQLLHLFLADLIWLAAVLMLVAHRQRHTAG